MLRTSFKKTLFLLFTFSLFGSQLAWSQQTVFKCLFELRFRDKIENSALKIIQSESGDLLMQVSKEDPSTQEIRHEKLAPVDHQRISGIVLQSLVDSIDKAHWDLMGMDSDKIARIRQVSYYSATDSSANILEVGIMQDEQGAALGAAVKNGAGYGACKSF